MLSDIFDYLVYLRLSLTWNHLYDENSFMNIKIPKGGRNLMVFGVPIKKRSVRDEGVKDKKG